jgi:hypothetical protein
MIRLHGNSESTLQRQPDPTADAGSACQVSATSPPAGTSIFFSQGQATLSPAAVKAIDDFVVALPPGSTVRIDGYASEDGPSEYNCSLSYNRAQAVQQELTSPSRTPLIGIAVGDTTILPHGETNELGNSLSTNRRVIISVAGPQPAPAQPTGPEQPSQSEQPQTPQSEQPPAPQEETPAAPPPAPKPMTVCGPDVTKQVQDAVALTRSKFAGWSSSAQTPAMH